MVFMIAPFLIMGNSDVKSRLHPELHPFSAPGMSESQPCGAQAQLFFFCRRITIFAVACQRHAGMRHLYTDLMMTPGAKADLNHRLPILYLQCPEGQLRTLRISCTLFCYKGSIVGIIPKDPVCQQDLSLPAFQRERIGIP